MINCDGCKDYHATSLRTLRAGRALGPWYTVVARRSVSSRQARRAWNAAWAPSAHARCTLCTQTISYVVTINRQFPVKDARNTSS